MKKTLTAALATFLFLTPNIQTTATQLYYNQEEYNNVLNEILYEYNGIVVENHPLFGYLTYKNADGDIIKAPYYTSSLVVEKQNIEEIEDRIGYIDELFPSYEFDSRDSTIENIKPGDNIYIRTDEQGYIKYISAYTDYSLRYGKIDNIKLINQNEALISFTDENGQTFFNQPLSIDTFVTKLGRPISINDIRPGEWAKFLVSRARVEEGFIEEEILEIVVDPDSRVVEDIYKGDVLQLGSFDNSLKLSDAQVLEQTGFGQYVDIISFNANPRNFDAYLDGRQTSFDYMKKFVSGSQMTAYVAIEEFMGKENVAKMNVQNDFTKLIKPAMVIDTSATEIRLMGGEILRPNQDSIVLKGDRLVSPNNILVGDTIQTIVDASNNLIVAKAVENIGQGPLTVYRGTIKKINDYDVFVVETFSLLDQDEWYYHPQPRTFALDSNTRFYDEEGFVENGIDTFLGYGTNTEINEIFTIVADGDKAVLVSKMPYTREVAKGVVYIDTEAAEDEEAASILLKDVFYYNVDENLWRQFDQTNLGIGIELEENGFIIKNGELIEANRLKKGDEVSVMLTDELVNLLEDEGDGEGDEVPLVPGYIILVK
ncbi:hypothetical protein AN641_06205 [Candidatus Epulonipiscioides gigas]|nr:hypothetical protein AN641_06205 [Epulopiscium sp. SCG-C07WGA-EpuloA2]